MDRRHRPEHDQAAAAQAAQATALPQRASLPRPAPSAFSSPGFRTRAHSRSSTARSRTRSGSSTSTSTCTSTSSNADASSEPNPLLSLQQAHSHPHSHSHSRASSHTSSFASVDALSLSHIVPATPVKHSLHSADPPLAPMAHTSVSTPVRVPLAANSSQTNAHFAVAQQLSTAKPSAPSAFVSPVAAAQPPPLLHPPPQTPAHPPHPQKRPFLSAQPRTSSESFFSGTPGSSSFGNASPFPWKSVVPSNHDMLRGGGRLFVENGNLNRNNDEEDDEDEDVFSFKSPSKNVPKLTKLEPAHDQSRTSKLFGQSSSETAGAEFGVDRDFFMDDSDEVKTLQTSMLKFIPKPVVIPNTSEPMDEDENDGDINRITPTTEMMNLSKRNTVESTPSFFSSQKIPETRGSQFSSSNSTEVAMGAVGGLVGSVETIISEYPFILNLETIEHLKKNGYHFPPVPSDSNGKPPIPQDYLSSKYKLIHRLGRGSFADVFKVQLTQHQAKNYLEPEDAWKSAHTTPRRNHSRQSSTNSNSDYTQQTHGRKQQYFAVKKTRTVITGFRDRKERIEEVFIMYKLAVADCKYAVRIFEAWEQYGYLYFVMDFCPKGTLLEFLDANASPTPIEEFLIWGILGQIAKGLQEIHSLDIIHLDLKPGNILISDSGCIKIGDFGCAACLPLPKGFEREGDRTYIAPEAMNNRFGKESDIFSLGLIVFEIATNIILPENGNHWQKLRRHDFSECSDALTRVSPPLVAMIKDMLRPSPQERISADRILSHAFVKPFLDGEPLFN
ncbi:hypothetical protein HDU82_008032 [Entophlyctis luteolus]|nr:hypothetical protein HDU82_008032 [Entophlyctis luteolus]